MIRQGGIDPDDDTGIDISHLDQRWNLGVPSPTIDPNYVSHAPGTFRIGNDHGHDDSTFRNTGFDLGDATTNA